MERKRYSAVVAAVAAGALLLTACSSGRDETTSPGNADSATNGGVTTHPTLTLGVRSELPAWNPSQANVNDSQQVFQTAYDTLIRRLPDGSFEPMLATDWSYNDDLTELTVNLQDGVTFSDGTEFDADTVVANYENLRDGGGPQADTTATIERIEVVDADTVVYHLSESNPAFLLFLSGTTGFQASPEAIAADTLDLEPVGSGPYIFDASRSTLGSTFTLTARDDYWAPDLQLFDEVTFISLQDTTARLNALISGQVDAAIVDVGMAKQAESAGLELTPYSVDWTGLILQDRDGELEPALSDVRVRQAINMAIDREVLVTNVLDGHGTGTSQFFGADTPGFDPELDTYYQYDPEKARQLMADAGFADGFAVTLPATASLGSAAILDVVTDQLSEIGIRVTWESFPGWGPFVGEVQSGDYPMPFMNQAQGDTWVEVRKMLAPEAVYNPLNYETETSKKLIEELLGNAGDEAAFEATAVELGTYITEEAWFAPIYRFDMMYFHSPDIIVTPQPQVSSPAIYNYAPTN